MNETAWIVGIDIAKRKFDIALLITTKKNPKYLTTRLPATSLLQTGLANMAQCQRRHIYAWKPRDYSETLAISIYGIIKSGQPFDVNFNHTGLAIQDGI